MLLLGGGITGATHCFDQLHEIMAKQPGILASEPVSKVQSVAFIEPFNDFLCHPVGLNFILQSNNNYIETPILRYF